MFLINSALSCLKGIFTGEGKTTLTAPSANRPSTEQTPLVAEEGRAGLTATYQGYGTSDDALKRCLIALAIYFVLAVVAYSYVLADWPIVNSLYFGVRTFTLIGWNDRNPDSVPTYLFTVFFILYAIVILGVFVGYGTGMLLAAHERAMERRKKESRTKVLNSFSEKQEKKTARELSLFRQLCNIIVKEIPLLVFLALLLVPMIYSDGWDKVIGTMVMTIVGAPLGFEDNIPLSNTALVILMFYLPLAIAVRGELIARVANTIIKHFDEIHEDQFMSQTMTLMDLKVMDTGKDGKVSKHEFVSYLLIALQKIKKEDLEEIEELFQKMDKDGSGVITTEDLVLMKQNLNV